MNILYTVGGGENPETCLPVEKTPDSESRCLIDHRTRELEWFICLSPVRQSQKQTMEKLGLVVLGMIAVVPALRPWLQCDARSTLKLRGT